MPVHTTPNGIHDPVEVVRQGVVRTQQTANVFDVLQALLPLASQLADVIPTQGTITESADPAARTVVRPTKTIPGLLTRLALPALALLTLTALTLLSLLALLTLLALLALLAFLTLLILLFVFKAPPH